jgi:hypothetical protein
VHKRLMLIATIILLGAPVARWPETFLAHPGEPRAAVVAPFYLGLMISMWGAAMIYDRTRSGRISRVYIFGFLSNIAMGLLLGPVGASPFWLSVTNWVRGLAG